MSGDLAFTYAALILSDDGQEVTADKMDTIVKAAGVTVEPYWGMLFGKFLATKSVDELVADVGAGACAALEPRRDPRARHVGRRARAADRRS